MVKSTKAGSLNCDDTAAATAGSFAYSTAAKKTWIFQFKFSRIT